MESPSASAAPARLPFPEAAIAALFALLFCLNYLATLEWMLMRWNEAESYMSHGWLIPPISLWLLWLDRGRIRAAPRSRSAAGLFLMAGALLIHLVAGLADVSSISGMTMPAVLLGFVWLRYGPAMLRAVWFPAVFLLFMVPPPEFVISGMNFALKLWAADMATFLLNLTGLASIRVGSFMLVGTERLAVGDVCSGLRSLMALMALSVLYAWLVREKGRLHVLAILATAVPAAIVGNGVRIFLVAYLVTWIGKDAVFRPLVGTWDLHLFTGAIIFAAAFGCLYLVSALIESGKRAVARKGGAA